MVLVYRSPNQIYKLNTYSVFQSYLEIHIRGAYDKFPDIFRMGTFIDSTHIKL